MLEPYDQGYRDGWEAARIGRAAGYRNRRRTNPEYLLGYSHGKLDGVGRKVPWWPAYAKSPPHDFGAGVPRPAPETPGGAL